MISLVTDKDWDIVANQILEKYYLSDSRLQKSFKHFSRTIELFKEYKPELLEYIGNVHIEKHRFYFIHNNWPFAYCEYQRRCFILSLAPKRGLGKYWISDFQEFADTIYQKLIEAQND